MSRRSWCAVLWAAAMVAGLAACGVPTQSQAQPIATNGQVTNATAPTTQSGASANNVVLYFVNDERLEEITRPVDQLPSALVAVKQLLSGVTADEKADGLLSAIPPGTTAVQVSVEHGVMTLNLSAQFKPTGDTYLQACAQIVFTVTAIPGISQVRFEVGGDPISAPTVDAGNLAVVDRGNYSTLVPVTGR